jgi:hypothetical protein
MFLRLLQSQFSESGRVRSMKTNGICPACEGKLSLWVALKAPTPFHIRCPHCRARLSIAMPWLWPFFILVLLFFAALAIASAVAWRKFGIRGLLTGLAGYLLVLLIAELVIGVAFFTFGKFTVKGAGKSN